MPEQSNDYRVVVFGAGGVGKSSLVVRFVKGTFRESYIPTIEDTYRQVCKINDLKCLVVYIAPVLIFNTYLHSTCQGDLYYNLSISLLCFSIFFFSVFFSVYFVAWSYLTILFFFISGVSKMVYNVCKPRFRFYILYLWNFYRLLVATRISVLFKSLTPRALINSQLCKGYL